jgi:type II secretory pathway component PulF
MSDSFIDNLTLFGMALVVFAGTLGLWLLAKGWIYYLIYYLLSLPLRREERARLFVDLLQTGLQNGQSPEQIFVAVAKTGDPSIGRPFRRLARRIENGLTLMAALEKMPRLLPRAIFATLKTGAEIGDYSKALAACSEMLREAPDQMQKAQNYVLLLVFGVGPIGTGILATLCIYVFPKFAEIFKDMGVENSAALELISHHRSWFLAASAVVTVLSWGWALFHIGGPRFVSWIETVVPRFGDRVLMWIPWWRLRIQRNFSTVLAIVLDAEIPEERGVLLAAQCTGNVVFERRAGRVVEDLRNGIPLPKAVRHLDDAGEFQWRLANAARGHGGFQTALAGWHETLSARAFLLEQGAAHVYTSILVLLNGFTVGAIVVTVFYLLISLIEVNLLW